MKISDRLRSAKIVLSRHANHLISETKTKINATKTDARNSLARWRMRIEWLIGKSIEVHIPYDADEFAQCWISLTKGKNGSWINVTASLPEVQVINRHPHPIEVLHIGLVSVGAFGTLCHPNSYLEHRPTSYGKVRGLTTRSYALYDDVSFFGFVEKDTVFLLISTTAGKVIKKLDSQFWK